MKFLKMRNAARFVVYCSLALLSMTARILSESNGKYTNRLINRPFIFMEFEFICTLGILYFGANFEIACAVRSFAELFRNTYFYKATQRMHDSKQHTHKLTHFRQAQITHSLYFKFGQQLGKLDNRHICGWRWQALQFCKILDNLMRLSCSSIER